MLIIPFPSPSCGKRSWDRGKQRGAEGRAGEIEQLLSIYLYRPMWKIQRLVFALLAPPLPLGPPSTRMVSSAALEFPVPFPALSRRLSCSPIVGYFLFGQWACLGRGGCSSPTSGPSCLHIVNSTCPSPIKQASRAWLYVVMSL